MRRRAFLTGLGTALTVTAGCIDRGRPGAGTATGDDAVTDDRTATDTRTPTDAHTDRPTTTDGHSDSEPMPASDVFADFECPSFSRSADRTVCYHDASEDAPLLLTAEPEVFDPYLGDDDAETLDFVLYNQSEWPVGFNPYDWGIKRYDDGEWAHVAPEMYPEPWVTIESGSRYTWSLPSESHPAPQDDDHQQLSVALESGIYAFHVTVDYEPDESTVTDDESTPPGGRTELVALFRLEERIDPQKTAATTPRRKPASESASPSSPTQWLSPTQSSVPGASSGSTSSGSSRPPTTTSPSSVST